ncbi:MAG: preprotein translocase subunit TatB [Firmicutes bacterium ZCTH02-B6]|nr:MAG: preprotein translocase subunit TatB [Firmicutes bacterium ZCTH02-B6]
MTQFVIHREIDARGSACPGPLMELIRALKAAEKGQVVAVISSDQGSKVDIPEWVAKAGHALLATEDAGGATRFVVQKAR